MVRLRLVDRMLAASKRTAGPLAVSSAAVLASRSVGVLAACLVSVLAACNAPDGMDGHAPAAAVGGTQAEAEAPVGAGPPERFGFGREASAERIAMWDIDVPPDGEGLPPGSGSVSQGRAVYNLQCLACHGPTGREGPNDPLVGPPPGDDWPQTRAAGHYWPYATTLFDYIRRSMPQLTPGTLTADETYAVIAYILYLNGLVDEDAELDAQTLVAIEMPARDRFVPDDRRGGAEIR